MPAPVRPRPSGVPELARRLPRLLVGIALALPVLLVIGTLVAAEVMHRSPPGPDTVRLSLPAIAAPAASSADCARLLSGLPDDIPTERGLLPRRILTAPGPPATAAWGGIEDDDGRPVEPPIVLHCGLARPPELTPGAALLDVDGVAWLQRPEAGATTWITADRAIYVGLTLPDGVGSAAIQDLSRGVKITLASRPPAS